MTNGELALACGGLREQQVRHVGAGDEQEEEDRAEEDVQRRADATRERRLQRDGRRVGQQVVALLG